MSVALAVRNEHLPKDTRDWSRSLEQLASARLTIQDASVEEAFTARLFAETVAAAARARQAIDVAREASETQIRAERRLGILLRGIANRGEDLGLNVSAATLGQWLNLAKIPSDVFDDVVAEMLSRGCQCKSTHVFRNAQRKTLVRVEAGIWKAFDGSLWTENPHDHRTGDAKRKSPCFGDLATARETIRRQAGLKKTWRDDPNVVRLDDSHARSRRMAQALSILGGTLTGESRELLSRAEHLQGEVAALLFEAYRIEQNDHFSG